MQTISPSKREKLQAILDAEKAKDHLALKAKMTPSPAKLRTMMRNVDDPITEGHRSAVSPLLRTRVGHDNSVTLTTKSQKLERLEGTASTQQSETRRLAGATLPKSTVKILQNGVKGSSEWTALSLLETKALEAEKKAAMDKERARKAQLQEQLNAQLEEKDRVKQMEKLQKQVEANEVVHALIRYREEEAARRAERKQREEDQKVERFRQVESNKEAQRILKERELAQHAEELKQVQRAMEEERAKLAAERASERAHFLALMHAKQAKVAGSRAAAEADKARDKQLLAEYEALLDRQQKVREEAVLAVHRKQERLYEMGKVTLGKKGEYRLQLEKLEEQYQRDKDAREELRRQMQRDQQAADSVLHRTHLLQQMQERKVKAKEEKEKDKIWASKAQEEVLHLREEEEEKRRQQLNKNLQHKQELEKQITEKLQTTMVADIVMSEQERKLNAKLLEHATPLLAKR